MKICLIGYMGSGKSHIGGHLAAALGWPFIDLDALIEEREGVSVADIISRKGELHFRKCEREALLKVLDEDQVVIALGGGTPCYYDNARLIYEKSYSLYLRMSVRELYERLKDERKDRPLIAHLDDTGLLEFIGKHLFERQQFYQAAAHRELVVGDQELDEIVDKLKNELS